MHGLRFKNYCWLFGLAILLAGSGAIYAGGSGLNTVIVINQASTNSIELGNYYAERRQIPPGNILRINWSGGNISWTGGDFQTFLLNPLLAMLADRQLTNQIDYVVLSMDIPFQTANGSVINSTTAVLFYGLKTDSGPTALGVTNSYSASENIFRKARPASNQGYSFLTTMLTAGSLAQAKQLVDQGVTGDGTFPTQPVVLAKSADTIRNLRYHLFDNAIFNSLLSTTTGYRLTRTNANMPDSTGGLLGLQTGLMNYTIANNSFVPGAMADSMTSYGGIIFGNNDQTSLLGFIHAGAAGSYGTVAEPQAVTDKFPNPQNYFYQSRGFSLAECYYQSLYVPYLGLVVGEPLVAPFRKTATGSWSGISSNSVLSGTTVLGVNFTAADAGHPLQRLDLFIDGVFYRTITNIAPQAGNSLTLNINNRSLNYTVPADATVASIATSLAALVNLPANSNATKVIARAYGDRIDLRSTSGFRLAPPNHLQTVGAAATNAATFAATNLTDPLVSAQAGTAASLTTALFAKTDLFLDSPAAGLRGFTFNGSIQAGTWLRVVITKTNNSQVTVAVTNQIVGGTPYTLAGELANAINAAPGLQGPDGVVAEDYLQGFLNSGQFNLSARSLGLAAARVKALFSSAGGLVTLPATNTTLLENISDLYPRNNLYVMAGVTNLAATIALDTSALADGFHELTAVVYEGSHVQTQSRLTIPVRIQNTTLNAVLSLVDLPDPAPVAGSYHFSVLASTNSINSIKLFSTGGLLGTVTGQPTADFAIPGTSLGVGLHPFYAVVETTNGQKYRTQPQFARLVGNP